MLTTRLRLPHQKKLKKIVYIVTRLTCNNKLHIKRYRLAQEHTPQRFKKDSAQVCYESSINKKVQEYEWQTNLLKKHSEEYFHLNKQKIFLQRPLFGEEYGGTEVTTEIQVSAPATKLPSYLEYFDISNPSQPIKVKQSYQEFIKARLKTLDFISKSQHSVPRHSCWGRAQTAKAFRYQAGEKILEAGAIIDRYVGREGSSMLTLTLPGQTVESFSAISRWSGWIINRIIQVIRRLKNHQENIYWFFVWEHQKRGALHLHMCVAWRISPGIRRALAMAIRRKFYQCLLELKDKDGVDCFKRLGFQKSWRDSPKKWQWDYQEIKKSVAGYFAKYCKKNTKLNSKSSQNLYKNTYLTTGNLTVTNSDSKIFYPSRYWGSSLNIKQISKKLTKEIKIEVSSPEEVDLIISRIIDCCLLNAEPVAIHQTEFQIQSPSSERVICSGDTITYRFESQDYPLVWFNCVTKIMWKSVCMDAHMTTFFGEELARELVGVHPCVTAK